jgi:tetratricopeptide (TPR) repeat protein
VHFIGDVLLDENVIYVVFGRNGKKISKNARHILDKEYKKLANKLYTCAFDLEHDGKIVDAENLYSQVLRMVPTHVNACVEMGNINWKRGNKNEGEAFYRKATLLDPECAVAHYNLAFAIHQTKALVEPVISEILKLYRTAIEQDVEFADAYYNYARILLEIENYELSIEMFNEYIRLENNQQWIEAAKQKIRIANQKLEKLEKKRTGAKVS